MDVYSRLLQVLKTRQQVDKTLAWCLKNDTKIIRSENLSPLLRQGVRLPSVFYVRGNLDCYQLPALAVVGARKASNYGLACAYRFSRDLAASGICIISGLARGIDGASHRGAINVHGKTIAVMGSGFANLYPKEHQRLAFKILDEGGSWLSEYPPCEPPLSYHFPQRNRLISGLSLGTLVIEARKQSGSLITALCGLEQGRDVFVIPGPIDSELFTGGHTLIQNGAKLVSSIKDIIEELPWHLKLNPHNEKQKSIPFSFGQYFTLSDWIKSYGHSNAAHLEQALKEGQVFELAPQRFLATHPFKESCQMQFSSEQ